MISSSEYVPTELVAVHPYGVGGPITSDPAGDWCYAAEGGSVACFQSDPYVPHPLSNYETPLWRLPVGSAGVVPNAMILDPDMVWNEPFPPSDPNALLYIAAGRDGLWAMRAGPLATSSNDAYRIDDSGDTDPATQHGRKWCNDVAILSIGEGANAETYVLALFARADNSRLRAYKLSDVRNVASLGAETGNELTPLLNQRLSPNPVATGSAYAFGMAVDENEPDAAHAMVYVAMGEHGILRVPLEKTGSNLVVDSGNPFQPLEHGPYFGAGSPYEPRSIQAGRSLYGSVDYWEHDSSGNPTQLAYSHSPHFLDVAVEDRGSGNHRIYAAVDHLGWCAFSLEVPWDSDIWNGSDPDGQPDFVQEGTRHQIKGPTSSHALQNKDRIRLVEDPAVPADKRQTYARRVELAPTSVGGQESCALVVATYKRPFIIWPERMNEGRILSSRLNLGPVDTRHHPLEIFGQNAVVLSYDVGEIGSGWPVNALNAIESTDGGTDLHVPEAQLADEFRYFLSGFVEISLLLEPVQMNPYTGQTVIPVTNNNLLGVHYDPWPPSGGTIDIITRGRFYRPGRMTIAYGPSIIDPDLLVASHNDAGIAEDGPVVFEPSTATLRADMGVPGPVTDVHGRVEPSEESRALTFGEIMDPRGGFVENDGQADYEYRIGYWDTFIAPDPVEEKNRFSYRWKAVKFKPEYLAGSIDSVTEAMRLYLTPPANKFSPDPYDAATPEHKVVWPGRPHYTLAATFEEYNEYLRVNFGSFMGDETGIIWVSNNGSPQGLWALSKREFQTYIDSPPSGTGVDDLEQIKANIGASYGEVVLGGFVTHPEFWNIDDVRTGMALPQAEYFIRRPNQELATIQTWYTDMFKLPKPGGGEAWMLAVGCAYPNLHENNPDLSPSSNWTVDPEFQDGGSTPGFQRMMVRLFDVSDPRDIQGVDGAAAQTPNRDSRNIPGYTIIGKDPDTTATFAKGIQGEDPSGTQRHFLLVTELGGTVYLYDIENLLALNQGPASAGHGSSHYGWFFTDDPVANYHTNICLTDSASNGVYGCAVYSGPPAAEDPETYVLLSVPRVGIEALKIVFDGNTPEFEYLGILQTPGHGGSLHYVDYDGTDPEYPYPLLYSADYDGGLRIFGHPQGTGQ